MKRTALVTLGIIATLLGLAVAVTGAALRLASGQDGRWSTPAITLQSSSAAIVTATSTDLTLGPGDAAALAERRPVTLRVSSLDGRPVFVGQASSSDITEYLGVGGFATMVGVDGRRAIVREPVEPAAVSEPPDTRTFWLAKAQGVDAVLVPAGGADTRFVLMNADGSPNVAATARVEFALPALEPIGTGLLVLGLLMAPVGLVLLVWGLRTPNLAAATR